jgi:hypothetical protein
MIISREKMPFVPATVTALSDLSRGYRELRTARWEAQNQGRDPNENSLSLSHLREQGVRDLFLVLMLYHGHVTQFRPVMRLDDGGLLYEPANNLHMASDSLFSLTEAGEAFAGTLLAVFSSLIDADAVQAIWDKYCPTCLVPRYEKENRMFRWGCLILKRFRQPAINQELILLAAEEMNWPEWFDDPLPRRSGVNPKVRLHDTIKDLNRRQIPHLVHFKGDGTGTRIGWEYC